MRRWLPAVALGSLLALLGLAAVLAARPGVGPTTAEQADALSRELRCPDCQGLSVADSPTRSAQEIRRQIDEMVSGGATAEEVRAHFVARYGEWILLAPSAPLYWLVPAAAVFAGLLGLGMLLVRGRRAGMARPASVSSEERQRLRDELEALDA
jgi:cytochrome c-type biogenesis protein CcmH